MTYLLVSLLLYLMACKIFSQQERRSNQSTPKARKRRISRDLSSDFFIQSQVRLMTTQELRLPSKHRK